tara:strand:- start:791 stop:2068 length:1278 start_codon:yes stop_codon:yes gene_type:complete
LFNKILKIKKFSKEIIFVFIIILIFYRSPFIFLNGRFMAEEGNVFFANAFNFSFLKSLMYVSYNSGYLNLWANIAGIIANFAKLEYAPLLSVYLSLIPKILIIYCVLYWNSFLFNSLVNRFVGCLIFLATPAIAPEVWVNNINSQLFFCFLMVVYCFADFSKKKLNFFTMAPVFLAGLSGLYSTILAPIFFYKYRQFKQRQDKYNFYIIFLCSITQLFLVVYAKFNNLIHEGKLHSVNLELATNFIYNVIYKSIFGMQSKLIINFFNFDSMYYFLLTLFFVSFFSYYLLNYSLKKYKQPLDSNYYVSLSLTYSFYAISFFVLIGAAGNYVGGRYAVLPSVIFLLTFLHLFNLFSGTKIRYLFCIPLIFSITLGLYEYKTNNKYYKFLECIKCPDWKKEVQLWNSQSNYRLKIWPYTMNKFMSLTN